MKTTRLDIPDVTLVEPARHEDTRGFLSETFNARAFHDAGIDAEFVQDNHALSHAVGTLRGLHYQIEPHAQGKLIRVVRGAIYDVAVDIRAGSPTYGRHVATELSAGNWYQLWIPIGFAHGYCTLEADTEVLYKVTGLYAPAADRGIRYDDPDIAIDWPSIKGGISLSAKDKALPRLADIGAPFRYAPI